MTDTLYLYDVERPVGVSEYVQIWCTHIYKKNWSWHSEENILLEPIYSWWLRFVTDTAFCAPWFYFGLIAVVIRRVNEFHCISGRKDGHRKKKEWKRRTQILKDGTMPILICWYEPWTLPKKAVICGSQKWNFYQQWEDVQEIIKLGTNISTVTEKNTWNRGKGWRASVEIYRWVMCKRGWIELERKRKCRQAKRTTVDVFVN